ncbi:methyltransferase domain-containing protein [Lentzea sp. NBRC 102530]|uniref:methyltransferase domain-containing protein n=1 Tax=Lentzea sp. NBRC 102530 TaxID=3032201 RepID=UPI0024A3D43E|nr:methyltransferase domain-containing protein [Lentzea sp. NBRC 102530]GLY51649.1 ubiquinone biosynthesis protein [Lentzea sp. NBRC 102530]
MPFPHALEQSLDLLRCPACRERLWPGDGAVRCPSGHTFTLGRPGYVSLLADTRATSGDDPGMVSARDRFLTGGHYSPVREAVAALASASRPTTVLDAGCGTGYYLAGVLDHLPQARGLGLDTSVRALRSAARAHARAAAAAWDVFRPLPLGDGVADVVLDVFAPRNPAEFRRVLRADGRLVVARPTWRHLAGLPTAADVDPSKEERLRLALDRYFAPVVTEHVTYSMALDEQDAADLLAMTPSARHARREAHVPGTQITVSVLVTAYQAR